MPERSRAPLPCEISWFTSFLSNYTRSAPRGISGSTLAVSAYTHDPCGTRRPSGRPGSAGVCPGANWCCLALLVSDHDGPSRRQALSEHRATRPIPCGKDGTGCLLLTGCRDEVVGARWACVRTQSASHSRGAMVHSIRKGSSVVLDGV